MNNIIYLIIAITIIIAILVILVIVGIWNETPQPTISDDAVNNFILQEDATFNSKDPYILCILQWGLGNRLKCLSSAIILARYTNLPLYVVWTDLDGNNGFGGVPITDLLKPPYPFKLLSQIPDGIPERLYDKNEQYIKFNSSQIQKLFDTYDRMLTLGTIDIKESELTKSILILSTWWPFKHPKQHIKDFENQRRQILLNEFIPSDPCQILIQKYLGQCDQHTVGAHLRGTDSCVVLWKKEDKCLDLTQRIMTKIRAILQDKRKRIFLCTDDFQQTHIQNLIKEYGDRIITPNMTTLRYTVEGQQESYAEIMTLARFPQLLLSLSSTFSGEVACMANIYGSDCILHSPSSDIVCHS